MTPYDHDSPYRNYDEHRSAHSRTTQPLYRGIQATWYVLYVIETVLLFRFALKVLGANPFAGFSDFIYTVSAPFAGPFFAVLPVTIAERVIIEWGTLLAMLAWWLLAIGIVKLFAMSRPVSEDEARAHLEDEEHHRHVHV